MAHNSAKYIIICVYIKVYVPTHQTQQSLGGYRGTDIEGRASFPPVGDSNSFRKPASPRGSFQKRQRKGRGNPSSSKKSGSGTAKKISDHVQAEELKEHRCLGLTCVN